MTRQIPVNTRLVFYTTVLATRQSDCHAQLVPTVLPHTPDAIEAWFRHCYERQGGLQGIDPTDAPARAGLPADRRRLIDEVGTPARSSEPIRARRSTHR